MTGNASDPSVQDELEIVAAYEPIFSVVFLDRASIDPCICLHLYTHYLADDSRKSAQV